MKNGDGEAEARLKERFARLAQDRDDLNNEMAGRDVGRISRFFADAAPNSADGQRRDKDRTVFETQLQIMLGNIAYRTLYEETAETLNEVQRRIDTVLERVQALQAANADALEALENAAARLPNGEIVFRDRAGEVRRPDGRLVEAELAATILWRGDEPSYEDWQALQNRRKQLEALEADARAGQSSIGEFEVVMDDEDDPPSREELESIQQDALEIAAGLEVTLDKFSVAPEQAYLSPQTSVGLSVPEL